VHEVGEQYVQGRASVYLLLPRNYHTVRHRRQLQVDNRVPKFAIKRRNYLIRLALEEHSYGDDQPEHEARAINRVKKPRLVRTEQPQFERQMRLSTNICFGDGLQGLV
jgi:hypothetical protein